MTRRKVKLGLIQSETERKACFKKRKKGLLKKVQELSTLCGIPACAIIYGPYEPEPETWPSSHPAVLDLLERYRSLPERFRKPEDQQSFTQSRMDKTGEQIRKQQRGAREKEVTTLMHRCLGGEAVESFRTIDLNDLDWMVGRNLIEVSRRISVLKQDVPQPSAPVPLETGGNGGNDEGTVAPELPVNEMQSTWPSSNASMVGPEMPIDDMQNLTWPFTNAPMIAPGMPSSEIQNLTWPATTIPSVVDNNFMWFSNNDSMVVPEVLKGRMQNPTWFTNDASMVAPEMQNPTWFTNGASMAPEMQNPTWFTNNASMVAPTWSTNNSSMVAPGMLVSGMQNWTWSTNNSYMLAPNMLTNEMQNITWSPNNSSMVAPEMPINEMPNPAWSANNAFMVAPEMPSNESQNYTVDRDMRNVYQQPWLSDFMRDDSIFQPFNNNGAGPSNRTMWNDSIFQPFNNNGAGPSNQPFNNNGAGPSNRTMWDDSIFQPFNNNGAGPSNRTP